MRPILACHQRLLILAGFALLMASLVTACGRLELRPRGASTPATPAIEVTQQPFATSVAKPEEPLGPRATVIDGRPYLVEPLPEATLYYEPWIDYTTVQRVEAAYASTRRVLQRELGIDELAPGTIYLALATQSARLAEGQGFPNPSWLMGLSTYTMSEGKVVDAKVFLNSESDVLLHTVGHELTHLAVPELPGWLGEGVAEYIGTRVERAMDPQTQELRMLVFRRLVRNAVMQDTLLDWHELQEFDWRGDHPYALLDLAYAEAWHLVEYIARRTGADGLRTLVALYRRDAYAGGDPFLPVLGVAAETVWQEFKTDLVENLTVEEHVGLSLCVLAEIGDQGSAITREWNQSLMEVNFQGWELSAQQLRGFQERWEALAARTAELATLGDASPIRTLLLSYFQAMARAMEEFARGDVASANQTLGEANRLNSQASAALQEALLRRPWLDC